MHYGCIVSGSIHYLLPPQAIVTQLQPLTQRMELHTRRVSNLSGIDSIVASCTVVASCVGLNVVIGLPVI